VDLVRRGGMGVGDDAVDVEEAVMGGASDKLVDDDDPWSEPFTI